MVMNEDVMFFGTFLFKRVKVFFHSNSPLKALFFFFFISRDLMDPGRVFTLSIFQ